MLATVAGSLKVIAVLALIGLSITGILIVCCCAAAKRGDEMLDEMLDEMRRHRGDDL